MLRPFPGQTARRLALGRVNARFLSTIGSVQDKIEANDFAGAAQAILELPGDVFSGESLRELRSTQSRLMRQFNSREGEAAGQEFPLMSEIHQKFQQLGSVSHRATTDMMAAAIRAGQPERAIEIWVLYLEALGKRTYKPLDSMISQDNHLPCSVTALAAYLLSCRARGVDPSPETAFKLVPIKNIPVRAAPYMNQLRFLSGEDTLAVNTGLTQLRQSLTDYSSPEYLESIRKGNFSVVQTLYNEMLQNETVSEATFAAFIRTFAETRQVEKAFKVWNAMIERGVKPTVEGWSALLRAGSYSHDSSLAVVESLWQKMLDEKVVPNADCYATRFLSLARNNAKQRAVKEFKKLCATEPDLVDTFVLNTVIDAHLRDHDFPGAGEVLDWGIKNGVQPNTVTFNSFLRSAVDTRQPELALKFLDMMKAANVRPDIVTYSHILDVLFKSAARSGMDVSDVVGQLLGEMKQANIPPNTQFYTILADGLSKTGRSATASRKVFNAIQQHNLGLTVETFGSAIDAEIKYGDLRMALRYFSMMPKYGLPYSTATFNQLLDGALKHGDIELAKTLFQRMQKSHPRTRPNKYTYMFALRNWSSGDLQPPVSELVSQVFESLAENPRALDYALARQVLSLSESITVPSTLIDEAKSTLVQTFDPKVASRSR